jgi:hypothetical protein
VSRIPLGVAASLLLHAAILLTGAYTTGQLGPPPASEPLQIELVPPPPPPPEAPPPESPAAPQPPPKPRPRPPKPSPEPAPAAADAGVPLPDAGPDLPDAGPPVDGGASDGGVPDAAPRPPPDPATVDLRPYVPPGSQVMLVLRPDRLRGGPFADKLEPILAPLPDYRVIFAPTSQRLGKPLTEAFGALVIASSDPRDVTATFLAVRADVDDAVLMRALGASGWRGGPVGPIGDRQDLLVERFQDPRVFYLPRAGWALLLRPEHLPGPPWIDRLWEIEAVTGEDARGPIAVLVVADTGRATVEIPGLSPLPVPDRLTVSVTEQTGGLVLTGAAELADPAAAKAFARALTTAKAEAQGSLALKLVLQQLKAYGLVERLQLKQRDRFVTFSTSLTAGEARALLDRAAAASRDYFLRRRR